MRAHLPVLPVLLTLTGAVTVPVVGLLWRRAAWPFVLATGVFLSLCVALMTEGNAIMAHVILGFWVVAQGVEIASQLVLYRRGI